MLGRIARQDLMFSPGIEVLIAAELLADIEYKLWKPSLLFARDCKRGDGSRAQSLLVHCSESTVVKDVMIILHGSASSPGPGLIL